MTRYQQKIVEISKARNSSKTSSKVRGLKWNAMQMANIQKIASQELMPSITDVRELYPNMSDYKINVMLNKINQLRKQLSNASKLTSVSGIRNSAGSGLIYLIEHELYSGWIKCGMTVNIEDRIKTYNCGDPLKRYKVIVTKHVENRRFAETRLKSELKLTSTLSNGEWFRIDKDIALQLFNVI
jgi:hypothetical protein